MRKAFFSSIKEDHLIKIDSRSIISEKEYNLDEEEEFSKIISPFEIEKEKFLLLGMSTSRKYEQVDFFKWKGVNCNDFQSKKFSNGYYGKNEDIEPKFNVVKDIFNS